MSILSDESRKAMWAKKKHHRSYPRGDRHSVVPYECEPSHCEKVRAARSHLDGIPPRGYNILDGKITPEKSVITLQDNTTKEVYEVTMTMTNGKESYTVIKLSK